MIVVEIELLIFCNCDKTSCLLFFKIKFVICSNFCENFVENKIMLINNIRKYDSQKRNIVKIKV